MVHTSYLILAVVGPLTFMLIYGLASRLNKKRLQANARHAAAWQARRSAD